MIYVLTRTSNRPRMFQALRTSLALQTHREYVHVVHSDDPSDAYVRGDIIVRGDALPVDLPAGVCGPELYQARLLAALHHQPPGWVIFVDDDDRFTRPTALAEIAAECERRDTNTLLAWRVLRERNRPSPATWRGDLGTPEGGLCWEGAAFHTTHLQAAMRAVQGVVGGDRLFWQALSQHLNVTWLDLPPPLQPQLPGKRGKGMSERRDATFSGITVAVPVLGRPHNVQRVMQRFNDPRIDLLFLPDADDDATMRELERYDAVFAIAPPAPAFGVPTYASKINHAYRITNTPFLLYASDDIEPVGDWVRQALRSLADPCVGVLSTNDQRNKRVQLGLLAVHGIVRRAYVEEHGTASLPDAGPIFFEGYRHKQVDAELSHVARARGAFKYDPNIILKHVREDPSDATYALGEAHSRHDRTLRQERIPTWPRVTPT